VFTKKTKAPKVDGIRDELFRELFTLKATYGRADFAAAILALASIEILDLPAPLRAEAVVEFIRVTLTKDSE